MQEEKRRKTARIAKSTSLNRKDRRWEQFIETQGMRKPSNRKPR